MPTRFEQYREARDRMPLSAHSPGGFVAVTRDERGEVTVRLRPGTFSRLSEAGLAEEIRAGLAAALAEYSAKSHELLRQLIGAEEFDRLTRGN
jgi:hypothetical protein